MNKLIEILPNIILSDNSCLFFAETLRIRNMKISDRKRGCLYGLAIGNALGVAIEFKEKGKFPLITSYRSGGPHSLQKGNWTDDTSMALALADSIFKKGWNLQDQMTRYLDWFQNGRYTIGDHYYAISYTTRQSLIKFELDGNANNSGDNSVEFSGNGSIVRLAPISIFYSDRYPDNIEELSKKAEQSSKTTHSNSQCISACKYMTLIISGLIAGEAKDMVLSAKWDKLKLIRPLDSSIEKIVSGSYRREEVRGSGWVVASLEAALWAFHDANNFEEAVLRAVNLGEDADTTGAVCGQIAGAYWGESNIPDNLVHDLKRKDLIEDALKGLGVKKPDTELKDYIDFGPCNSVKKK